MARPSPADDIESQSGLPAPRPLDQLRRDIIAAVTLLLVLTGAAAVVHFLVGN